MRGPGQKPAFEMQWHWWVVLIAGSSGSALRAVRPPNLHITPGLGAISSSRRECDGLPVALTLGHHGPRHPRDLVGECDRSDFGWLARQQRGEPGPMFAAVDLGIADDRQRPGPEQTARIAVALFADAAEPFPTPLECCFGTSPIQAEKFRPDRKAFGSAGNGGDDSSGQHRTDAGSFIEPHAHLVGP